MNPFNQSYCPHSSARWGHQTNANSAGFTRTLSEALKRASASLDTVRSSSNMKYTQLCLTPEPKALRKNSKRRPRLARSVSSTLQGVFDTEEHPIVVPDQTRSLFDRCSSVAGLYSIKKTKRSSNSSEQDWDFRCRGEDAGVKARQENDNKILYESGSFWISSFKSSGKFSMSSTNFIGHSNYDLQS